MNVGNVIAGGLSALLTPGGILLAGVALVTGWAWPGRPSRRALGLAATGFVLGFLAMAGARHPVLHPLPPPWWGLFSGDGLVWAGLLPAILWLGLGLLRGRPATRHPGYYGFVAGLASGAIWVAEQGPVLAQLDFRSGPWWLYVFALAVGLAAVGLMARIAVRRPGRWATGSSWMLVALGLGLLVGAYQRVAVELLLRWPLSGGG